jgi:hypothetical protein
MVTHLRYNRFKRVDISPEWNIMWIYLKEDDLYRAKIHVVIVVRMRKDCRHIGHELKLRGFKIPWTPF